MTKDSTMVLNKNIMNNNVQCVNTLMLLILANMIVMNFIRPMVKADTMNTMKNKFYCLSYMLYVSIFSY